MSPNVAAVLKRRSDYHECSPAHQWAIDSRLGILDWEPTAQEIEEYLAAVKAREAPHE